MEVAQTGQAETILAFVGITTLLINGSFLFFILRWIRQELNKKVDCDTCITRHEGVEKEFLHGAGNFTEIKNDLKDMRNKQDGTIKLLTELNTTVKLALKTVA